MYLASVYLPAASFRDNKKRMNLFIDPNLFIGMIFSSDNAHIMSEFSQRVKPVSRRPSVPQTIGYCHVNTLLATAVVAWNRCGDIRSSR